MSDPSEQPLAFADELNDAAKFCATIARANPKHIVKRGMVPKPTDKTATISFIEFEQRVYGVTAKHVIDEFTKAAKAEGTFPEGYFLPALPGTIIAAPFVIPPAQFPYPRPDIAVQRINADQIPSGKRPFLLKNTEPDFPVKYALAAGFPTGSKSSKFDARGEQLQLVGVHAVATAVGPHSGSDQIQFYSEVDPTKMTGDLSGISGGPVFWSDGTRYGLLGFIKEAMQSFSEESEVARVSYICQRTDYETFAAWADHADRCFKG